MVKRHFEMHPFTNYEVDLGAEKLIAATDGKRKIAVEVKSFLRQSKAYEFHTAIGQYATYLFALNRQEPDRKLYLAVTDEIHTTFLANPFLQELIAHYNVHLLIFNPEQTTIVQWT